MAGTGVEPSPLVIAGRAGGMPCLGEALTQRPAPYIFGSAASALHGSATPSLWLFTYASLVCLDVARGSLRNVNVRCLTAYPRRPEILRCSTLVKVNFFLTFAS